MRVENRVSLWLGQAVSLSALTAYVKLTYDNDGDLIASKMMQDYKLDSYDESLREMDFTASSSNIVAELLAGFSYDSQIIPAFESRIGSILKSEANAIILLYNFDAQNEVGSESSLEGIKLKYFGSVGYSRR